MTNTLARKNDRPTLEEVLEDIGPLPTESVLLGMANDGLPMLLDAYHTHLADTPNVLVWNGESSFLKMVAEFILHTKHKREMEFVVFTNNTEEWEFLANKTNTQKNTPCIGVIPFWDDLADQVLLGLASWIQGKVKPNHAVIVLIEGVENVLKMDLDARQNLNYIFLRGRNKRVFAIGTAPKDVDLMGLQNAFGLKVEHEEQSEVYEFPEGETQIQVWIPKENRK